MIIFLVVASYFIVFSFGFIIASISKQQVVVASQQPTISSHAEKHVERHTGYKNTSETKQEKVNRKIEIDDRKFITEVKTDSLEKKFDDLGKTTLAKDDALSANVNKLASLKKTKEG
jgi:hypothetical protein